MIDEIVTEARKSFPNAKTDLEAVCLTVSYLRGAVSERNSLLNINARQCSIMAVAYLQADEAKRELAELKAMVKA